ncbi:tRNA (adenosine(37)-N6)-threonylcarbamoyltransferase complex dimerization subunit type 1 TsaB [Aneurinibacillus sp. Ricciae_BoGa-3]|uniref:tRNA (adenosine(37)-N6)-threonylcarbamoyltransferase complex dimerization subunit type 1 TsaB n=1 Tax=Aneurinibacillus sp. Ricciae_BoGa-3 TaxID=3022697 RepID=UPI002340D5AB|nr:tRNA (adenosine(37)-N6)-threonylcarbamoyltransferase complex dimerization subunit type 1 TsaB [Aneurinibacillus sp. Ricciae_BoGa-3]WCK54999.1 tRNA (adenosine(37)-N6)-threonylcarbamoyltransferase complex dimerization subunit type 1 TsaB [Aneurinibacillus sp. Ricciae_BoGa-3]
MNILAIDTSNLVLAVSVITEDAVLGEFATNLKKNHSVRLMPMISQLLDEIELEPSGLSAIVAARGPGSYTGVRIGVSTAKSMAWSLGIPLVGVSSLETLAYNGTFFQGLIVPLFDARRGQVFTGAYRWINGSIQSVSPDRIVLFTDMLSELKETGEKVLFLGDDLAIHREAAVAALGDQAVFAPASYQLPRAAHLAQAGLKAYREGRVEDTQAFIPSYLQMAEAEAKWLASRK